MRQLGILAAEEERIVPNPKWYQFWKKKTEYELIGLEDAGLELVVAYLPEKKNHDLNWLQKTNELFTEKGISHIVCTKKALQQDKIEFEGMKIHRGREIMIQFLPKILSKMAKIKNIQLQQATVAYLDASFSPYAEQILHSICREVRYIILVTNNKNNAAQLAIELYEEYGIPIDLVSEQEYDLNCDFVIWMDGQQPNVPSNAVIINLQEDAKSDISAYTYVITLDDKIITLLPFVFNRNDILQALWSIGLIGQSDLDMAKIKRVYSVENMKQIEGKT